MGSDFRQTLRDFHQQYGTTLVALLLLQLATYGYLFTAPIFTNHTFPNTWLYHYPSFKTLGEGRWFADLIILLQGGSGVQPLQMLLAAALQSLNGILFARLVGLHRRADILLAAACLCLYPAFLDYYSFAIDHVSFVLGDTLVLLGLHLCARPAPSIRDSGTVVVLLILAVATHQTKLALIGLLGLVWLLQRWAYATDEKPFSTREAWLDIAHMTATVATVCLLYFASTRITLFFDIGVRAYINTPAEAAAAILASFGVFADAFGSGADYLPRLLRFLPVGAAALGGASLLYSAYRRHPLAAVPTLAALALVPVALHAPYIVNHETFANSGRIVTANGYALLFFLATALQTPRLRPLARVVTAVLTYFFFILGTQESNAATFKSLYDVSMIQRITTRIESVVPDLYAKRHAIVVAGRYPDFDRTRYVRTDNRRNASNFRTFTFEPFRQVEILNYFLGRPVVQRPRADQLEKTLASMRGRKPWPAPDSVYVIDDVIAVLLEPYQDDLPHTWVLGQEPVAQH